MSRYLRRRSPFVDGAGFREARIQAGLDQRGAAALLLVTVRTVQNWEKRRHRVPYSAFRLMRLLRGGRVLGEHWDGFTVRGDTLYAPDGKAFRSHELGYLSLVFAMARAFQHRYSATARSRSGVKGASPLASANPPLTLPYAAATRLPDAPRPPADLVFGRLQRIPAVGGAPDVGRSHERSREAAQGPARSARLNLS